MAKVLGMGGRTGEDRRATCRSGTLVLLPSAARLVMENLRADWTRWVNSVSVVTRQTASPAPRRSRDTENRAACRLILQRGFTPVF